MPIKKLFFFGVLLFLFCCKSEVQPKPKAYLRLKYEKPNYKIVKTSSNFSFEHNTLAQLKISKNKSLQLIYSDMKATLYMNYNSVEDNIDSLLNDAYQLPFKHISKAESIPEKIFINNEKNVYGTLFSVVGDAASQFQFFLTDSANHFLVGSVYFYARPNYDSLFPAIKFLEKDLFHLIETFEWK